MEKEDFTIKQNGLFADNKLYAYNYTAVNGDIFTVMADTLDNCRLQRDKWLKSHSVAFTGHRNIPFSERGILRERLRKLITVYYKNGSRFFLSGMAIGFDLLAAEIVLELKETFSDISLIAVIPFQNQDIYFTENNKKMYVDIQKKSDKVLILHKEYFQYCYLSRNDYLLKHSSRLVAYFNGDRSGGTAYTVRKADSLKMPIYNLFR